MATTLHMWWKAIATIQPVGGERPISTKMNFVASRGYHNGQHICGANLLRHYKHSWRKCYCNKATFGGIKQLQPKLDRGNRLLQPKKTCIQLYYSNHVDSYNIIALIANIHKMNLKSNLAIIQHTECAILIKWKTKVSVVYIPLELNFCFLQLRKKETV
jgi:hypothetical protein